MVRFHYAPLNLPAPAPDIVVSPAQGIDAIYFPGTSTGYWFGESDSYTEDSGIITKVSQRRVMALEAGSLNEQGTVSPGIVARERQYQYLPFQPPSLPEYTSMTESWAGIAITPPTTTYTVTHPNPYGSPWAIETIRPDGTGVTQSLANQPDQWNDGLLVRTTIYDSAGGQLRQTVTNWEQGDYDSPRVKSLEETDQLGLTKADTYDYLSPTNQVVSPTNQVVAVSQSGTVGWQGQMAVFRTIQTDYEPHPGYAQSHIFNLPKVVQVYDQAGPGGSWSEWESPAPGTVITSDPVVAVNADGRLEVFARGTDNALWHIWQTAPGGSLSGWAPIAPGSAITSDPVAEINADGRLEVFARGTDSALWHLWQTAPGGGWSAWASLGGQLTSDPPVGISDPAVGINADGRLEVFARAYSDALYHTSQAAPAGPVVSRTEYEYDNQGLAETPGVLGHLAAADPDLRRRLCARG